MQRYFVPEAMFQILSRSKQLKTLSQLVTHLDINHATQIPLESILEDQKEVLQYVLSILNEGNYDLQYHYLPFVANIEAIEEIQIWNFTSEEQLSKFDNEKYQISIKLLDKDFVHQRNNRW